MKKTVLVLFVFAALFVSSCAPKETPEVQPGIDSTTVVTPTDSSAVIDSTGVETK